MFLAHFKNGSMVFFLLICSSLDIKEISYITGMLQTYFCSFEN